MLERALKKRAEWLAKIDKLFAKDSVGAIDYNATAWDAEKDANYKEWMAGVREQDAIIATCDDHRDAHSVAEGYAARGAMRDPATRSVDELSALGSVRSAVTTRGLGAARGDPLTEGMLPVAEQILDIAREAVMGAQTTSDAEGGYTVPIIVSPDVEIHYAADAPMVALATYQERETGSQFRVPTMDASGVKATRVAENAKAADPADLVFGSTNLGFDRFDTPIYVLTNELIQDSAADMVAEFTAILFNQTLRSISDAATDGTGGNNMDGFTENAHVSTALTTATNVEITWQELLALYGAVSTRSQRNAIMQFNQATETYLMQQVDGDSKPVLVRDPAGGIAGTGGGTIIANGARIGYALNPKIPAIAAASKSVYCGDFSRYRMFGCRNANGHSGIDIIVYRDSAFTAKNTVGLQARARRAGKYVTVASGADCRFITQKA